MVDLGYCPTWLKLEELWNKENMDKIQSSVKSLLPFHSSWSHWLPGMFNSFSKPLNLKNKRKKKQKSTERSSDVPKAPRNQMKPVFIPKKCSARPAGNQWTAEWEQRTHYDIWGVDKKREWNLTCTLQSWRFLTPHFSPRSWLPTPKLSTRRKRLELGHKT